MNQSIVFAIAAMVCYGLGNFIYKQAAAAGIRADHFLMAQSWFFGRLVLGYALATHRLAFAPAALWGSLAGGFIFTGFYYFIRSLAARSASTNAAISRLNFIVTVLLVIALLGEPLTFSRIAGLALALLTTWLLLGAAPAAAMNEARRRSLLQVLVATLLFAASNFFHTVGLRHGATPETLAAAQAALFVPLATGVVYLKDRRLRPPPATYRYAATAAVVLAGATIFLLRGITGGQASVLVPTAQMGFLVAALLGIFFLRERVTLRKAGGLGSALAALAVLAFC